MVFENGEELSEDRTPILDERDSVSYEEFGGDQVHSNATKQTSGDVSKWHLAWVHDRF